MMTWTIDKPTVPGWYWWRISKDDTYPLVLEIVFFGDGKLHVEDDSRDVTQMGEHDEWAGPLTPPGEEGR